MPTLNSETKLNKWNKETISKVYKSMPVPQVDSPRGKMERIEKIIAKLEECIRAAKEINSEDDVNNLVATLNTVGAAYNMTVDVYDSTRVHVVDGS